MSLFLSRFVKSHRFSTFQSSTAERLFTLLQNNNNIERALTSVKPKLDHTCVNEVLHKCSINNNNPQLGLRFFIWAGFQSSAYRHSGFMYKEAIKLLRVKENPRVLVDVIENFYGSNSNRWMVSVKMFKVVLGLCKEAGLADEGLWVLRKMKEFGLQADTVGYNFVIRLLCEKGDMERAGELMREMGSVGLCPDMTTCVLMIKGYCDVGRLEDACGLLKGMRENGCSMNVVACSAFLEGACRFGSMEMALELLGEMESENGGWRPNAVTYTTVIQSFCEKGQSMKALEVLDRMEGVGCVPNKVLVRTLIQGLCSEERVEEAYKCVNRIVESGSVSYGDCYSCMVIAVTRVKKLEEAVVLFKHMIANGVAPDGVACNVLLKELCLQGHVLDGVCLYDELEKISCLARINSDICSSLLVGLCQQKHFVPAAKLAKSMLERGVALKASHTERIIGLLKECENKELEIYMHSIAR